MYHVNPDMDALYAETVQFWPNKNDTFVPGVGPVPCKVMFIGEAPGSIEARTGFPIAGKAGLYFDELLGLSGVNRQDVFITNAVKFYRPGRVKASGLRTVRPDPADMQNSITSIRAEVELVEPELIITMGSTPLSFFFSMLTIGEARKGMREVAGHKILATYNPAIVAKTKQKHLERKIHEDFRVIGNYIRSIS